MLKNRIPHKEYKELTPTIILRKSRGRTDVNKIIASRLATIKARKAEQPALNSTFASSGYGMTKGGFARDRNGKPRRRSGANPLSSRN